jgi:hypothetical protein
MALTLRPATLSDALAFAGGRSVYRKALLYQVRRSHALLVLVGETPVALAMVFAVRKGLAELAVVFAPGARGQLVRLTRLARLTCRKMAYDGVLIKAHVRGDWQAGQRLAALAGFTPGLMADRSIWLWRLKRRAQT